MKKKYNLNEPESENGLSQNNRVEEPMAAYGMDTEMDILPALTEEEMKEFITGDELMEAVTKHIHELFNKK